MGWMTKLPPDDDASVEARTWPAPLRECGRFLRGHLAHVLLSPLLGFTLVTVLHEAAHALLVVAQGGRVVEFSFVPGGGNYGHVRYAGAVAFPALVSLAPYLMWGAFALGTAALAWARPRLPFWLTSSLFVWAFAVPLLDIGNAAVGWLAGGSSNDLAHAFGRPGQLDLLGVGLLVVASLVAGYFVQRRLYQERALSVAGYALTSVVAGAALLVGLQLTSALVG
jgi:hypothetical protein